MGTPAGDALPRSRRPVGVIFPRGPSVRYRSASAVAPGVEGEKVHKCRHSSARDPAGSGGAVRSYPAASSTRRITRFTEPVDTSTVKLSATHSKVVS